MSVKTKENKRVARHQRIRKIVVGTSNRPRLCVHRSLNHFYAQVVDDAKGKVLFGMSTQNKEVRQKIKNGGNVEAAIALGKAVANAAKTNGVNKVCFDRGGYRYHGRVKAFSEAVREGGVEF
ncbi:MAG: 50S ribosomal protein L18 [Candidatus Omnitrophica bacterium]|nr:50S ribosomal protein L18 [Candidatus Omnitrophota bacterium]